MKKKIPTGEKMNTTLDRIVNNELSKLEMGQTVQAGCNGPYKCLDTNVRNTSHWINTFKYYWKKTENEKYLKIIKELAEYLCLTEHYGISGAIRCMSGEKFDSLNGTIGQGWVIEGLIAAYECSKDKRYLDKAIQIYKSQKYNYECHLWERIELDGRNIGPDTVFNHELWFAADSAMILKYRDDETIRKEIQDFVDHIESLFDVYAEGLFKHHVVMYEKNNTSIKRRMKNIVAPLRIFDQRFDNKSFERGYHLFDLYGFAILYQSFPDAKVFESEKFRKALNYGLDVNHLNLLINANLPTKSALFAYNRYAYAYNSPAFEYPYVDYVFNEGKNKVQYESLWELQKKLSFDDNSCMFIYKTDDPETLTARIYELVRYLELLLN